MLVEVKDGWRKEYIVSKKKYRLKINYACDLIKNSRHLTITNFTRSPANTYARIKSAGIDRYVFDFECQPAITKKKKHFTVHIAAKVFPPIILCY